MNGLDPDDDNDGIFDEVDTLPTTFSNDFDDSGLGGTTFGTIVDRGDQIVTITHLPSPGGVKVVTDPAGGPTAATLSFCGISQLSLPASIEFNYSGCSSTVEVLRGVVDITVFADDGTVATMSLSEGNTLTFDPTTTTFTADADNDDIVIILIDGGEFLR